GRGRPQAAQNLVNLLRIAQQPAANVLFVNLGRGTTEVKVDAGDGMAEQLLHRAGEVGKAFTDELGEDRPAGGIFIDRPEDVFFRARLGVDAEKLGEEIIRRAVVRDHAHEGEVGDVLHGGERRERQARGDGRRQGGHAAVQDGVSSSSSDSPSLSPSLSSACWRRTRSRISLWSSTPSKTFCAT